jgi:hypothetical protein
MAENPSTIVDVAGLSEAEALALVDEFADKFGWQIPLMWTRADADYVVEGITDGLRGITDAEWERVRASDLWLEQVKEAAWERGGQGAKDAIYDAVTEVVDSTGEQ